MGSREAFDVAVVGGGAAGCVVARRLAERGDRRVVLLEAGVDRRRRTPRSWRDGWNLPTATELPDWDLTAEPNSRRPALRVRRGRVLGGTSWLTRFAVRGAPADFDAWAARGNPGWSWDEVLPVFRRLETDLDFGGAAWHGDGGPIPVTRHPRVRPSAILQAAIAAIQAAGVPPVPDVNAPDAVGVGRMPMSTCGTRRVTTVDAYLPPGLGLPSLTIRPGSTVASIVIGGSRATGARLLDGRVIAADEVVLAAGTYGSPTILMRSGIGRADDLRRLRIEVHRDLPGVGANLADHPGAEVEAGWQGAAPPSQRLHAIATFRSSRQPGAAVPDLMFWIADPSGEDAAFTIDPILMKPRSRGSVRLRSADPTASPSITLPNLEAAEDVDRLVDGARFGFEVARRPELRRIAAGTLPAEPRTRAAWRRYVQDNAYSLPHVVGTCAMGPASDPDAVVNARGYVHGIEGLRVIDASIVPDATAGFPHMVTIMVAEKLSEPDRP